ncbi:MAG: ribosome biogenesis GTPase YlqF, partial [Candidatus Fimadaptatus sp.]
TPGMLWPKLADQEGALLLAFLGTIRDQITDVEGLSIKLLDRLMDMAPQETAQRFHIADTSKRGPELLDEVCRGRGFLLGGGRFDTDRGAAVVLDEFRAGKVARLTWQRP